MVDGYKSWYALVPFCSSRCTFWSFGCTARNLNYTSAGGGVYKTPVVMVTSVRTEDSFRINDLVQFVMFDLATSCKPGPQ